MTFAALLDELDPNTDTLLLLGPAASPPPQRVPSEAPWEVRPLVSAVPRPREHGAVVLIVHDLADLRLAATGLGNYGRGQRVGVWFERRVAALPLPQGSAGPRASRVTASHADGFVLLTFAEHVPARPVLLDLARAAVPSRSTCGWPRLGAPRGAPRLWPPADPHATVALPARLLTTSVDSPPDLILLESPPPTDPPRWPPAEPHHVLGRNPEVRVVEPDLTWSELDDPNAAHALDALRRRGPLSLGPVDVGVYNPIGFDTSVVGPAHHLQVRADGALALGGERGSGPVVISPQGRVSDADIGALRQLPGLSVDWRGGAGPQALVRGLTTLAALGVPLVTGGAVPPWAHALLPEKLSAALDAQVDLADPLSREEHSVRLRRAALSEQGSRPWRRRLAVEHGRQEADPVAVSILLVTRRPERVPFALRQVARQRGVRVELVLATHGFTAAADDLARFRELAPQVPVHLVEAPESELFGDVLTRAAGAASGDVLLKVDDDDWYSPEFVADLLLAREYAGATITGCPPEFTFLEPLWLTVRRPWETEAFAPFVAGGTMMIERDALTDLGGFRSTRRYVDANLLSATTDAGGTVYRTHGLGYVLHRGEAGHTWDAHLGYFLRRERVSEQWRGFRPSALLEWAAVDAPSRSAAEEVTARW